MALLRDMQVVELRDGMVICSWFAPTASIATSGSASAAAQGTYPARTPVLLSELTGPAIAIKVGDRVQDMDDGTRVHVPVAVVAPV